jgi:hypothetical protein
MRLIFYCVVRDFGNFLVLWAGPILYTSSFSDAAAQRGTWFGSIETSLRLPWS